jgi:hypothetical protein
MPVRFYRKPKPIEVLPGQQPLFDERTGAPNPKTEADRVDDLRFRLTRYRVNFQTGIQAIDNVFTMLDRGVSMPDIFEAFGLKPPIDRVSRPLKPWRLRPGSNMDVIATMLEEAGRKGVTEEQMVERLRELGRLGTAREPRRSVHWSITELRNRTKFSFQRGRANGDRWYTSGTFDTFRPTNTKKS